MKPLSLSESNGGALELFQIGEGEDLFVFGKGSDFRSVIPTNGSGLNPILGKGKVADGSISTPEMSLRKRSFFYLN